MNNVFGDRYTAVGVTDNQEGRQCGVVIHIGGLGVVAMSETAARKLADDLLRNANYLWPIEDEQGASNE